MLIFMSMELEIVARFFSSPKALSFFWGQIIILVKLQEFDETAIFH